MSTLTKIIKPEEKHTFSKQSYKTKKGSAYINVTTKGGGQLMRVCYASGWVDNVRDSTQRGLCAGEGFKREWEFTDYPPCSKTSEADHQHINYPYRFHKLTFVAQWRSVVDFSQCAHLCGSVREGPNRLRNEIEIVSETLSKSSRKRY